MKTITIQDDALLERARKKAEAEKTTVDNLVRNWLESYVREIPSRDRLDQVLKDLQAEITIDASEWNRERRNER